MLIDGQLGFPMGGTGFTPRGVGLTPVAMQLTASQGGISAILAAQDQEEERKRRIETIVGMMSARWGFVSQEGVERCARRLGLECLWEEGMGEEQKRTLTIAGHGVLVDVEFRAERVNGVVLHFEESREGVVAGARAAAEVLEKDLKGDGGDGYVTLDGFVTNLEILGSMDRLGGAEVNCFDAVDGIYRSLDKVFHWGLHRSGMTRPKEGGTWWDIEETICRQNGRPLMHTRGRVGLAVQYWVERRHSLVKQTTTEDMDIDSIESAENLDECTVWTAIIECEVSSAEIYPPIRISDAWVSEPVGKPTSTEVPINDIEIDWQDPPPTLLSPKSPMDGIGSLEADRNAQPRAPDVRFVATFKPPVIVPLQIALQIHASVGSPLTQESLLPTTYESLVFADIDSQESLPTAPRSVEKTVTSYGPSNSTSLSHKHKSTLLIQPNDYARAITDLPFSHPRQILAVLPILRQWVLNASLLRRSFVNEPSDDFSTLSSNGDSHPKTQPSEPPSFQTIDAELAEFMSSPLPSDSSSTNGTANQVKAIDIALTTTPLPRFNVNFPNPRYGGKLASIGFNVGLNGTIEGVDVDDGSPPWQQNGAGNGAEDSTMETEDEKGKERVKMREKVKRVLEVSESIGVCVEWMCGSTPASD